MPATKQKIAIPIILMLLISFSSSAQLFQWASQFEGPNQEYPSSVKSDKSSNVYSAGYFVDSVDFDPGPGVNRLSSNGFRDMYICKQNSTGAFLWVKQIGGTGFDEIRALATDSLNNVYFAGYFTGTVDFDPTISVFNLTAGPNQYEGFLCKLDSLGDLQWVKQFQTINSAYSSTNFTSISFDKNGNILLTGAFAGSIDFNPGPSVFAMASSNSGLDAFVCKLDASGNFIWAKKTTGPNQIEFGFGIETDANNNVYVAGRFKDTVDFDPGIGTNMLSTDSGSAISLFLLKLDASGNFNWAKQIRCTDYIEPRSMVIHNQTEIYISGYFIDTLNVDTVPSIHQKISKGASDIFLIKADTSGALNWIIQIGDTGNDASYSSLNINSAGEIIIAGNFAYTVDFDPGAGNYSMTATGYNNIFLAKYTSAGSFVSAAQITGSVNANLNVTGADASADGSIYLTGQISGDSIDFDPDTSAFLLSTTSSGNNNPFVCKYKDQSITTGVQNATATENFFVYPVPANELLNIRVSEKLTGHLLQIFDLNGKLMLSKLLPAALCTVPITQLSAGVYYIKIGNRVQKFVKM